MRQALSLILLLSLGLISVACETGTTPGGTTPPAGEPAPGGTTAPTTP